MFSILISFLFHRDRRSCPGPLVICIDSQLSKCEYGCFGLNEKIFSLTQDTEDRRRMPPPPRQPHPGVNGGTGSSAADTPTPPPPLPDAPPPMETPPTPAAAASRLDMLVGGGSSMKSQPTSRLVYEQVCIRNSI